MNPDLTCTRCDDWIDESDVDCYLRDQVLCKKCRCQVCGVQALERGYDTCAACAVEYVDQNPSEVESFDADDLKRFRAQVHEQRNRTLSQAYQPGFLGKRQAS